MHKSRINVQFVEKLYYRLKKKYYYWICSNPFHDPDVHGFDVIILILKDLNSW